MQVGVDEAGDEGEAGNVDDLAPLVAGADAGDGVAADRHVAGDQRAGHHVENAGAAQHHVGRLVPSALRDPFAEFRHARCLPVLSGRRTESAVRVQWMTVPGDRTAVLAHAGMIVSLYEMTEHWY